MNTLKYLLIISSVALFSACSSDSNEEPAPADGDVTVTITTEVETKANVTTQLGNGDAMNVFPKTYGRIDAPNMVDNVKAVCSGSVWTMTPEVKLAKGKNAFIYAVAPYNASYTEASAIPVDIAQQVDLLYSGEYVPVSYTTHNAKLTMKHALALVSFNISSQGYSGSGQLSKMSISGEKVYTKGTMNVSDGKITGTSQDAVEVTVSKNIDADGWTDDLPRIWQIPFSTKVNKAVLSVTIDGKKYDVAIPEVEMRKGFQYIFRLVLTNYGLEFIPGAVETISLNQSSDSMTALNGYGVLTIGYSGAEVMIPAFTGDDVFGTVTWGDGFSESYAPSAVHQFSAASSGNIVIECWNSTGFELNNLNGIETIDLTGY